MHRIGDKVLYGTDGVMTVVDVREVTVGGVSRNYYVLKGSAKKSSSETFVPTDSEELLSKMRPLLTKSEILGAIREAASIEAGRWEGDGRARLQRFRAVVESGDRAAMIAMIRSIYNSGRERTEQGKRLYLADETVMRRAEQLIHSEFSEVLGIPEEDVPAFIEGNIGK